MNTANQNLQEAACFSFLGLPKQSIITGWIKQKFTVSILEARSPKARCQRGHNFSAGSRGSFFPLQLLGFARKPWYFMACKCHYTIWLSFPFTSSHCLLHTCPSSQSTYASTNPTVLGAILFWTSSEFVYNDPIFKKGHILRYGVSRGLQHIWGGHKSLIT